MASYSSDYTNRYIVRYRAYGKTHKFTLRYGTTAGPPTTDIVDAASAFLDALHPQLTSTFAILSAEFAAAGTSFTLPWTSPVMDAATGDAGTLGDSPRFYGFAGRSTSGQPWRLSLYGASPDPGLNSDVGPADFRLLFAESAPVAAAVAALEAATTLTAIDGAPVIVKQYANIAYSAYYQRKARG